MWTSSHTDRRAARFEVRTLRLPLHRSFAKAPKRATVERRPACYIELPQRLWDRIILSMFICCLFTFLHALLGFGVADHDLNVMSNHTRTPLFTSALWSWNAVGPNENQKILAQGGARVMVDWHGNYELLPSLSTTPDPISAATIAQAFLGPTPAFFRSEHGTAGEGYHSIAIKAETSAGIPVTFRGNLYDPFQLGYESSVEGGEDHGRYPVRQPRTAFLRTRKRRFGRCRPEEVCL